MPLFRRDSRLQLAFGGILLLSLCSQGSSAEGWKERLLTEAPPKWRDLEQYYSKIDVSYRKVIGAPPEGKPFPWSFVGTVQLDIRENGERIVCTTHRVGKDRAGKQEDSTQVDGVNSRYAFQLVKTTPDADTFVLANLEPVSDKAREKIRGKVDFTMIFKIQGKRLTDIIEDPLYTIKAYGVQRKEREVVQMEYDFPLAHWDRTDASQKGASPVEHGTVIFDPKHSWCVLKYHFDNPNWIGDGTLEYGEEVDGFPIPRRCTYTAKSKKGHGNQLITYEFDKIVHRDIPESEFTLSAFGLPEMPLPGEQKPQTLWRWLLGIGIALGVLAVLLRVYVKKKRRQMPQQV